MIGVPWLAMLQWVGLATLLPPARRDLECGRVENHWWLVPLVLGVVTTVSTAVAFASVAVWARLGLALVVGVMALVVGATTSVGGADAKGVAVASLLYPVAGTLPVGELALPLLAPPGGLLVLGILVNCAVIAPVFVAANAIRGSESLSIPWLAPFWLATITALTVGPLPILLVSGF